MDIQLAPIGHSTKSSADTSLSKIISKISQWKQSYLHKKIIRNKNSNKIKYSPLFFQMILLSLTYFLFSFRLYTLLKSKKNYFFVFLLYTIIAMTVGIFIVYFTSPKSSMFIYKHIFYN